MIDQKNILVTGGTSGIGEEIAKSLYNKGNKIFVTYRNKKKIKDWQKKDSKRICMIEVDFNNESKVQKLCTQIEKSKINIDILINNAGIYNFQKLINLRINNLKNEFNINCFIPTLLSCAFAKQQKKNKRFGNIINILSFATIIPSFGRATYAASKTAFSVFTKTMAAEFYAMGVARVNGIIPGVIPTKMNSRNIKKNKKKLLQPISIGKFGSTKDISNITNFLISEEADYLNGSIIDVSGGKFLIQNQEDAR
jgi:3-oxoacyl-[acyl-carrier protein] reductase